MELTLAKKDLVKLLSRMQGVAERKSTMPILANVLLAVEGPNALRVAATDLYLSIAAKMSAKFGIHLPCYGTVGGDASGLGFFVILRESNQL